MANHRPSRRHRSQFGQLAPSPSVGLDALRIRCPNGHTPQSPLDRNTNLWPVEGVVSGRRGCRRNRQGNPTTGRHSATTRPGEGGASSAAWATASDRASTKTRCNPSIGKAPYQERVAAAVSLGSKSAPKQRPSLPRLKPGRIRAPPTQGVVKALHRWSRLSEQRAPQHTGMLAITESNKYTSAALARAKPHPQAARSTDHHFR